MELHEEAPPGPEAEMRTGTVRAGRRRWTGDPTVAAVVTMSAALIIARPVKWHSWGCLPQQQGWQWLGGGGASRMGVVAEAVKTEGWQVGLWIAAGDGPALTVVVAIAVTVAQSCDGRGSDGGRWQ